MDRDIKLLNDLYGELIKQSDTRNIVTLAEFEEFIPLYQHPTEDTDLDMIKDLTYKFTVRFDLYQNITIVDNDGKEILTLPRILMPVKSISEKFDSVVSKFHAEGTSEIPKYAAEATSNVLKVLLASQGDSNADYAKIVREYQEEFRSIVAPLTKQVESDESIDYLVDWS